MSKCSLKDAQLCSG